MKEILTIQITFSDLLEITKKQSQNMNKKWLYIFEQVKVESKKDKNLENNYKRK